MISIEQMITPPHILPNIVEHLRSHLDIRTLYSSELSDLKIIEIEIQAFSTCYNFSIDRTTSEEVTSSIIDLGATKPVRGVPKTLTRTYIGQLIEILEPGAQHAKFDFKILEILEK